MSDKYEIFRKFEELERLKPTSYKQQVLANGKIDLKAFGTIPTKLIDKLTLHAKKNLGYTDCNVKQSISQKGIKNDPLK